MRTRLLRLLPPEPAHKLTLGALKLGLGGRGAQPAASLSTSLWGLNFSSPLGLAAGFDKDGEVMSPMLNLGFGFVEVGTITPEPQLGNAKPRIFRAPEQRSVINRYGFNSLGHASALDRLTKWREANPTALLGVNVGMNKGDTAPLKAYLKGLSLFEEVASYLVVNLSSPNTPGLRDQQTAGLGDLIKTLHDSRQSATPILVKIAPDLDEEQIDHVTKTALGQQLDGLIVSNTTLDRPDTLPAQLRQEAGGLSGALLTQKALKAMQAFSSRIEGQIPLIGVGGLMSGDDAVRRLKAGADLLQVYTGLIYRGPGLIRDIHEAIVAAMAEAKVSSPQELKGLPL